MPCGSYMRRDRQREKRFFKKIMAENFANLGKKIDIQIQKAQRVSNRTKTHTKYIRHIIIKLSKVNDDERILKIAREKQLVTCNGTPPQDCWVCCPTPTSEETLQGRREFDDIFKALKEKKKKLSTRNITPGKTIL